MKLTRKQKVLRNAALLAALWLFLSWSWNFPALTSAGLLRRGEKQYLLEKGEIIHAEGRFWGSTSFDRTVFARSGDDLLVVYGDATPVGWRMVRADLYSEEDRIHLFARSAMESYVDYMAFGDLRGAKRAELDVTMEISLGKGNVIQESYTAQGVFLEEDLVLFALAPKYSGEDESEAAQAEGEVFSGNWHPQGREMVLRLYDGGGTLIHEKAAPYPSEISIFARWPEVRR